MRTTWQTPSESQVTENNFPKQKGIIRILRGFSMSRLLLETLVIPKLMMLPNQTILLEDYSLIWSLELADPYFSKPGDIELILRFETFEEFFKDGLRKCDIWLNGETKLVWIISGKTVSPGRVQSTRERSMIFITEFYNPIERFFEVIAWEAKRELSLADTRLGRDW